MTPEEPTKQTSLPILHLRPGNPKTDFLCPVISPQIYCPLLKMLNKPEFRATSLSHFSLAISHVYMRYTCWYAFVCFSPINLLLQGSQPRTQRSKEKFFLAYTFIYKMERGVMYVRQKWCNREEQIWLHVGSVSFTLTFVFYCFGYKLRMLPTAWNMQDSPFSRLWPLKV